EPKRSDQVDQRAKDRFERVHFVDIGQADESKRGEHENSDSRPEVAAVNSDGKLKEDCSRYHVVLACGSAATRQTYEFADKSLRQKKDRGEQNQERDQFGKSLVAGESQEHPADHSAQDTYRNKTP